MSLHIRLQSEMNAFIGGTAAAIFQHYEQQPSMLDGWERFHLNISPLLSESGLKKRYGEDITGDWPLQGGRSDSALS